jgi:uncharacterized SAM-binding protein YcdF (DUF218 family)
MFLLKKMVSVWLMPVPFCLTLLVIGLWLVWSSKRINLGRFFLTCGVILLLLFSNRFVSNWLLRPLELAYPPVPELAEGATLPAELTNCRTVVVLGGGHVDASQLAAINKLSSASRARLVEGVRIFLLLPEARLVVSGRGAANQLSHAAVQAQAAVSLGVPNDSIVRLESTRDTEEESEELSRLLGEEPFVLVTSAWHLRRATALMRHQRLNPIPGPCDYMSRPISNRTWKDFTWDTESLSRSTWAVYERLGFLWAKSRGKI